MKIKILLIIILIASVKIYGQYTNIDPYYKSASFDFIENSNNASLALLDLKNSVLVIDDVSFMLSSKSIITPSLKSRTYFYDDEFHKGELLLSNDRYHKDDFMYRLNLDKGQIELKNLDNQTFTLNASDIILFSMNIKGELYYFKHIDVSDSPYFYNSDFHPGELILTENRYYKSEYQYRFNQNNSTLDVKNTNDKIVTFYSKEVIAFSLKIEDKVINFIRVPILGKSDEFKLLQIIYFSNKLRLLRDPNKELKNDFVEVRGSTKIQNKYVYQENYHYYISKMQDALVEVEFNEKSFLKVFPEKQKVLRKLFSQPKYKDNLTVSKVFELMKTLDNAE